MLLFGILMAIIVFIIFASMIDNDFQRDLEVSKHQWKKWMMKNKEVERKILYSKK